MAWILLRITALAKTIEKNLETPPKAVLRSLHDVDGDFEIQTQASGGSNGVLVPPWLYHGKIAVTTTAQSPFRHVYSRGKVGVAVPADAGHYRIIQALYPQRTRETCRSLHVNLDFRVGGEQSGTNGVHRFWIGARPDSPAVEVLISTGAISLARGATSERIGPLPTKEWQSLQLDLDLRAGTVSGRVGSLEHSIAFSSKPFLAGWPGRVDIVGMDAIVPPSEKNHTELRLPALEFDNFAVSESPIAPPKPVERDNRNSTTIAAAQSELNELLVNGPFPMTYGMAEGTPHDVPVQMRGEPDRPGAIVPRGFIKALGGGPLPESTSGSGRLELANWLTRTESPLAARVMVNRIWQYHFGHGLVRTPNDFGTRGSAPTHPELLDYLAINFMRSGWSIKVMHRLLVLSSTYQQSSAADFSQGDPARHARGGELFSPFARRRLSAEELRDSILETSRELDQTLSRGHPFPSPLSWAYTQHAPFSALYDHNKRSAIS